MLEELRKIRRDDNVATDNALVIRSICVYSCRLCIYFVDEMLTRHIFYSDLLGIQNTEHTNTLLFLSFFIPSLFLSFSRCSMVAAKTAFCAIAHFSFLFFSFHQRKELIQNLFIYFFAQICYIFHGQTQTQHESISSETKSDVNLLMILFVPNKINFYARHSCSANKNFYFLVNCISKIKFDAVNADRRTKTQMQYEIFRSRLYEILIKMTDRLLSRKADSQR